jgi:signal transduction histidine kinase
LLRSVHFLSTGIYRQLPEHIARILDYGFTEMLNNAIEHSRSKQIRVTMVRVKDAVRFSVIDRGIGIFRNIREQYRLASDLDALQQLLKGKQTTAPASHSGGGSFSPHGLPIF